MKNIKNLSYIVLTVFSLLLLTGCDDDSEQFIITAPSSFDLAELSITDVLLDANNVNNPAITLSWSKAAYDQQASVNYSVEFSSDNAFTNPVVGGSITDTNTLTFSVNELNSAAGNAGLSAFAWSPIYARVVSSLGTQNGLAVNSNVITFNVYPFYNYPFEDYFLVGDATAPGWDNNGTTNPYLYRSPSNASEFSFTGFFNTGAFKVLETKGLWQPQWGTNDGTSIDVNDGTGSDPNTFPDNNNAIPTAGNYTFTINFSTRTYTFVPYNTAAVVSPAAVMIDGSASASPVAMTQLAFDTNIWYANSVRLTPGDFQFMADGNGWGDTVEFSGTATAGGGSIPVPVEDDYDVWFNALTGQYIFVPLNL